jgi:hypothetical protein
MIAAPHWHTMTLAVSSFTRAALTCYESRARSRPRRPVEKARLFLATVLQPRSKMGMKILVARGGLRACKNYRDDVSTLART